jgi:hypothetical protein
MKGMLSFWCDWFVFDNLLTLRMLLTIAALSITVIGYYVNRKSIVSTKEKYYSSTILPSQKKNHPKHAKILLQPAKNHSL